MNTTLAHILGWPAVVATTILAVPFLLTRTLGEDDTGLGTGLLTFLALIVVGCVGGLLSGRALGFVRALVLWTVISVGLGLAATYRIATEDGAFSTDMFVHELATGAFLALNVLVPALALAAVGHGSRR